MLMHSIRKHILRAVSLLATGVLLGLLVVGYLQQQHHAAYLPRNTQIGPVRLSTPVKRAEVAQVLKAEIAKLRLTLRLPDKSLNYSLADTGLSYDVEAAARQVKAQGDQFFGSQLFKKPGPISLTLKADETKLTLFAQNIAAEQSSELVKAKFLLSGQTVQVQPGKGAAKYDARQLEIAARESVVTGGLVAKLSPQITAPPNTAAQLAQAQRALQAMIDAPGTITVDSRSFTTTPADRFGWIIIDELPNGDFKVTASASKISAYANTIAAKVYIAPTTTTVTLLDDAETARQTGKLGASLPVDAVTTQIRTRLEAGNPQPIPVVLTPLPSPVRYTRTYSRSPTGLNLLVRDFAAERRSTFGVVVDDLSGPIDASYNASTSFVTASIFKAFLAYAVLNKVDTGEYTMATLTPSGTTVQTAIDKMIRVSDNQTAYELHQLYGFTNIDPFLHSHGFGSTVLNNYNASGLVISSKTTIPRDTAELFARLQAGTLLSPGSSSYLLDLLKNQIYRAGIPLGSSPSVVADKVGFLDSYIHDAGIVYTPRGTYVLVVLTKGGSWSDIAELSRRIHDLYVN